MRLQAFGSSRLQTVPVVQTGAHSLEAESVVSDFPFPLTVLALDFR